jgi:hypothetical protein
VIPVFHQHESPDRLQEVLAINPTYICVSPQNGIREKHRRSWARNVHAKLDGVVRTHGLATTGSEMMKSISWRSVDSKSWAFQAGMGDIMIEWEGRLKTLPIGRRLPTRRKLDERMLKKVDEICAELELVARKRITRDTLRDCADYRYLFNAHQMTQWSKRAFAREQV